MTRALASEGWGKKALEYLSLLHIAGDHVFHILLERAHNFPRLPLISDVAIVTEDAIEDAIIVITKSNTKETVGIFIQSDCISTNQNYQKAKQTFAYYIQHSSAAIKSTAKALN